ncbi:MAG: DUF4234 domain-containing protein [Clostridiales bacterium]|nr:DUF4234 domain-containing protein [Clostridiales bacterium]
MRQRNLALCIIFSIITCGIYELYWIVCVTDDANELSENPNYASGILALLLTIITCNIYGLYWAYQMGEKIDIAKQKRGRTSSNSGILYLILQLIFPLIGLVLMQNEVNQLLDGDSSWNRVQY